MSHTSSSSSSKPAASSTSASSSATAAKKGGGGYVVAHEAVGTWLKNRVLVAGEDYNVEGNEDATQKLDEAQIARLQRLGGLRDATGEELKARAEAKAAAEEAGEDFQGYSVPEPPPEEPTMTAGGGQVG